MVTFLNLISLNSHSMFDASVMIVGINYRYIMQDVRKLVSVIEMSNDSNKFAIYFLIKQISTPLCLESQFRKDSHV